MPEKEGVCIIAEHENGEFEETFQELVGGGREIAGKLNSKLYALIPSNNIKELYHKLDRYDLDKIYLLDTSQLSGYAAKTYAEGLAPVIKNMSPKVVLCCGTLMGRDIAVRLAAKLRVGVASDCVGLELDEESLRFRVRQSTYGGKVDSVFVFRSPGPIIAAIRPGIMEIGSSNDGTREQQVITIKAQSVEKVRYTKVIDYIKADPQSISIDEAEIIVSGGGGISKCEDFMLLEELAKLLGGTVATSRIPVDRGWFPVKKQVGQTGSTVAPKLYVACGISGAIYHTIGMKDSKYVIAINKDRNAPIFNLANVSVIGDLSNVVSELLNKLRERFRTKEK